MTPGFAEPPVARLLRSAAEAVLLGLVAFAPWPFASVPTHWELVLRVGLAVLAILWAAHAAITRRFTYTPDWPSAGLLGLVLLTAFQLVPLPEAVVRLLSPQVAEWHHTLRPERPELLPGESDADVPPRPDWLPLTIDPAITSDFLAQLLAVFLAYAVVRNFLASERAFRRLAWVGFANGVLLAAVAIAQPLSGSRGTIYWRYDFVNEVFGPFVNKNHYADYLGLCIGLGLGLLLRAARKSVRSPEVVGLAAGLGLMMGSIPLSLSRGGLAAVLVAVGVTGLLSRKTRRVGALAGLAVVAVGIAVWFGSEVVERRFGTLFHGADNRTPLWRELAPLAERFPLTGTGGGTLPRAEQAFRTWTTTDSLSYNSAANEYLEAAIEGGVLRLAITLGLAAAVMWTAAAGYRRLRGTSVGPLLLGGLFGLTVVVTHSVVDFGTHNPAVALLAAAVMAHVGAVRRDRERGHPGRSSPAKDSGQDGRAPVVFAGIAVALVGLLVAWSGWRLLQVERLVSAADRISRSDAPQREDRATAFLETATRLRPDDAELWSRLSAAYLAAGHELPALRAARTARDLGPLLSGPHLRLGTYSGLLARTEPATVHFDRAKRVGGFDPDVWYLSGAAALARGETAAAWSDWRESLRRDPRRLGPIVRAAGRTLPTAEIRDRVLPDDPEIWVAATGFLELDAAGQRTWQRAATARWKTRADAGDVPTSETEWIAWAGTHERLGEPELALAVWRLAWERLPASAVIRDRLAEALEAEERYEEAVPHLEWLLARSPTDGRLRDRLDAARHALKLWREIAGP